MTEQTQHTPGPWTICYDGQIDSKDGEFICSFRWDSFKEFNDGNNAANARLIAAAPDMERELMSYQAIAMALDDCTMEADEVLQNILSLYHNRMAIAKARGQS